MSKLNKDTWGALANYVSEEEAESITNNSLKLGGFLGLMRKYNLDIGSLKEQLKKANKELKEAEEVFNDAENDFDEATRKVKRLTDKIND